MSKNKKNIHLLSEAEIEDLYLPPSFNQEERVYYFSLNTEEMRIINYYKNTRTRLYFIIQLGYFKATKQFYSFNFEDVKDDTQFVLQTCLQIKSEGFKGSVSRNHNQKQKDALGILVRHLIILRLARKFIWPIK